MALPFAGSMTARVIEAAQVSIHGDVYYDVIVAQDPGPGEQTATTGMRIRVPRHALDGGRVPAPGDWVELQFLMQQVTRVVYRG